MSQAEKSTSNNILNKNVYSSLLARRREEHQLLIQHIKKTDDYEKKYKLLKIALEKILSIIDEGKAKLLTTKYSPNTDGFPKSIEIFEIIGPLLENTCLFGDLLLQIPKFSITILSRQKNNWRTQIQWSLQYFGGLFDTVAEVKTLEMLTKLKAQINKTDKELNAESLAEEQILKTQKSSKPKKKIHKGPGLADSKNEL